MSGFHREGGITPTVRSPTGGGGNNVDITSWGLFTNHKNIILIITFN